MRPLLLLFIITCLYQSHCHCHSQSHSQSHSQESIVINEIMADPTPARDLPEWEYIELYNISEEDINLKDWELTIGSSKYHFEEDVILQVEDYLIICHKDAMEEMSRYGRCHGFKSFKVTNSGCELTLVDEEEYYISQVEFSLDWHSDDYKEEGGWSLEQIDARHPCAGKRNWGSSVCGAGGTPGTKNSISRENIIKPEVDYICFLSDNIIEVYFNQKMNVESLLDVNNYLVIETQSNPIEAHSTSNDNSSAELIFSNDFEEDRLYTLEVNNILNCKDIAADTEMKVVFGIAEEIEQNDVIINEILFNPSNDCVEYLELYNRSEKVIDISSLMVGTVKQSFPNPADTTLKEICFVSRSLLPHSYLLLSIDGDAVKSHYVSDSECFLDLKSMPSFPNEEGRVIVCDKTRNIIDEIFYSDKMHYDLLAETQGVSLERISSERSSDAEDNWHSAAFNVNYGTPGYKNSMTMNIIENNDDMIDVVPEIFSPDGDGRDDNCGIYCNFDKEGYSVNIKIFDTEGNMIRELLHNSLVEYETCIFWDGCDDNRHVVTPGIYVVVTELFDLTGFTKREKDVVTVYN